MAYIGKEDGAVARKIANKVAKKYGYKLSVRISNHSSLNISVQKGKAIKVSDLNVSDFVMREFITKNGIKSITIEKFETLLSDILSGFGYPNLINYFNEYQAYYSIFEEGHRQNVLSRLSLDSDMGKMLIEVESEVKKALNYYDKSDAMIDYFNTAFYFNIDLGQWNKPYISE